MAFRSLATVIAAGLWFAPEAAAASCATTINCDTTTTLTTTSTLTPPTVTSTVPAPPTSWPPGSPPPTTTTTVTTPGFGTTTSTSTTTLTTTETETDTSRCPTPGATTTSATCPPCPPCPTKPAPSSSSSSSSSPPPAKCSVPVEDWKQLRLDWTDKFPKPGRPEPVMLMPSYDFPTIFTITDDLICGEKYTVYLGSTELGKTSDIVAPATVGEDTCGRDTDKCIQEGYSHGSFLIPEGSQIITIAWEEPYEAWNSATGQYRFHREVPCDSNEVTQNRLRKMGKCDKGWDWIKVEGGWQCEGGRHHVTDEEVAKFQG